VFSDRFCCSKAYRAHLDLLSHVYIHFDILNWNHFIYHQIQWNAEEEYPHNFFVRFKHQFVATLKAGYGYVRDI